MATQSGSPYAYMPKHHARRYQLMRWAAVVGDQSAAGSEGTTEGMRERRHLLRRLHAACVITSARVCCP